MANYEQVNHFRINLTPKKELGRGAQGTVHPGVNLNTNDRVAAKRTQGIFKQYFNKHEFEKEADLLRNRIPPHQNIIKVHDFTKTEYVNEDGIPMIDLWLITELCELRNLKVFAFKNDLSIEKKIEIMYQSALAVGHLHGCKPESIAHRDVKPENLLVTGSEDNPIIKLCDFGSAKSVVREGTKSVTMGSLAGTTRYQAPEQFELHRGQFKYNKQVDIFSLGVTLLALLKAVKGSLMSPETFKEKGLEIGLGEIMWVKHKQKLDFTFQIHEPSDSVLVKAVKDIIEKMIQFEPSSRLSASEVAEQLAKLRMKNPLHQSARATVSGQPSAVSPQVGPTYSQQSAPATSTAETAATSKRGTTPGSQRKTIRDSQQEKTTDSQQETTPDHQQETTPDSQQETIPDSQQETTPDSQQETTPHSQQETIPYSQQETTPDSNQESNPNSQWKTATYAELPAVSILQTNPSTKPRQLTDTSVPSSDIYEHLEDTTRDQPTTYEEPAYEALPPDNLSVLPTSTYTPQIAAGDTYEDLQLTMRKHVPKYDHQLMYQALRYEKKYESSDSSDYEEIPHEKVNKEISLAFVPSSATSTGVQRSNSISSEDSYTYDFVPPDLVVPPSATTTNAQRLAATSSALSDKYACAASTIAPVSAPCTGAQQSNSSSDECEVYEDTGSFVEPSYATITRAKRSSSTSSDIYDEPQMSKENDYSSRSPSVSSEDSCSYQDVPSATDKQSRTWIRGTKVVALSNFKPNSEKRLSFNKGDVLTILNSIPNDPTRYRALDKNMKVGIIPTDFVQRVRRAVPLHPMLWYHGTMTQREAHALLIGEAVPESMTAIEVRQLLSRYEAGTFLVYAPHDEDKMVMDHAYTLHVVRPDRTVENYRIFKTEGTELTINDRIVFDDLQQLVHYYEEDASGLCINLRRPLVNQGYAWVCADAEDFLEKGWIVRPSDIKIQDRCYKGTFTDTRRGEYSGQRVFIIKRNDQYSIQDTMISAAIMTGLSHKNVVKLIGVVLEEKTLIVTEYLGKERLYEYLRSRGPGFITSQDQINFARDVCHGMHYLEQKNIVHRKLMARSILLSDEGTAKIGDFTFARPVGQCKDIRHFVYRWAAPEVITQAQMVTSKSDMWSFGVLLWEIYSFGIEPYPGILSEEIHTFVMKGGRMQTPENCPNAIYHLMSAAWNIDPSKRPTFSDVCKTLHHVMDCICNFRQNAYM